MKQEEHAQQSSFFQWTEVLEKRFPELARFWAVPNGGARHPVVAGKLKAEGVKKGILDVVNVMPTRALDGPLYRGLILEFKSSTGRLSPEQRDWCQHFREQGFRVEVPRSWVEAALITIDYFGLPAELKRNLPLHRVKEVA